MHCIHFLNSFNLCPSTTFLLHVVDCMVSVMRALGVPTRSVTNYESAHDTDCSMTIDYHWGEDEQPMLELNDSVW